MPTASAPIAITAVMQHDIDNRPAAAERGARAEHSGAGEAARHVRRRARAASAAYSTNASAAAISASTSVPAGGSNQTVPMTTGSSTSALRTRVMRSNAEAGLATVSSCATHRPATAG